MSSIVASIRRHPGRTVLLGLVTLVVLGPIGWYLGSPVFIRTSLVEPAPTVAAPTVAAPTVAAPTVAVAPSPSQSVPPAGATPSARPTTVPPTAAPFVASTVAAGTFQGTDEFHFGRGTATILEVAPGSYHLRLEDFSVRNGPDLYVYLSTDANGYSDDALELGTLKATDGSFGYDLPAGVDPASFRSAIIWCKQFSHLFATASFVEG